MEDYRKSKFAKRFENKTRSLGKQGFTSILKNDSLKSDILPSKKCFPSQKSVKNFTVSKKQNQPKNGLIQIRKKSNSRKLIPSKKQTTVLQPIKSTNSYIKVSDNMIGARLRSHSKSQKQIDCIKEDKKEISFEGILKDANAEDFFMQMDEFSRLIKEKKREKAAQSFYRKKKR